MLHKENKGGNPLKIDFNRKIVDVSSDIKCKTSTYIYPQILFMLQNLPLRKAFCFYLINSLV